MRIAYINLVPSNFEGRSHSILSKINMQAKVASELGLPFDFYWLPGETHPGDESYSYLKINPVGGGSRPGIRFNQARALNKLTKTYDRILLRYPLVDPLLFFLVKNKGKIILEHHTKELEELQTTGDIRLLFEKWLGGRWIKSFRALTAVTPEIVDYEISRSNFSGPTGFFPNSIDLDSYLDFQRKPHLAESDSLQVVMVSTYFSTWQGLDTLLDQIEDIPDLPPFELHLAGKIDPELILRCQQHSQIKFHDTLTSKQVFELYQSMDLGVGSLAVSKKGLKQATALKVREYLAAGLPVVLAYDDPAIPKSFPYVLHQSNFNLKEALEFAKNHRGTPGKTIREAAVPLIDSKVITKNLYEFCINS